MSKNMLDEGRYVGKILEQGLATTPAGNVQAVFRILILGRPDPANPNNYFEIRPQVERYYRRVFNANTASFAFQELAALGFKGTSIGDLDPKSPNYWNLVDQEFDFWCKHGVDQNKLPKEEWSVGRSRGPISGTVDEEKIRELDYMFASQLRDLQGSEKASQGLGEKVKRTQPSQMQPVGAGNLGIDDSDIPF